MQILSTKAERPGLLALLLFAGLAQAGEVWKTKPAKDWTAEEALQVLQDSPWAKEEHVAHPPFGVEAQVGTTITLGTGRRPRPRETPPWPPGERQPGEPPREPSPKEFVTAAYLVRWESAAPVEEAFARLEELGERTSAAFQAPAPRRPDDRYVITVKTTKPPSQGPDLFAGMDEAELKRRARLTSANGSVAPLEVERRGVGAAEAMHFFFPRAVRGRALLRGPREGVEFRFEGERFKLTTQFTLESAWVR